MQNITDLNDIIAGDLDMKKNETASNSESSGKRTLFDALEGQTYIVREIDTSDEEMNSFLFRLGCYSGEPITIISRKRKSCIVAIKDSRYNLDRNLCEAIII